MSRAARLRRALVTMGVAAIAANAAALPADDAVRTILASRIASKQGVGFAVVLFEGGKARIVTAGFENAGGAAIDADTEFEIGSITKTFTSLLLADAGQGRNEIFAESELDYVFRAVDAQISFSRDAGGRVSGLVLKQNGRQTPGKRID